MIVNNSLDEVKKRENALSIIKNIIETEGRSGLYDLTGLAGGFIASSSQLSLLETYVGPAIFEDEIQERKIKYEVEGEKGVFNSLSYVVEENKVKLFCNIIFSFLSEHNLDKVLYEEFKY